MDLGIFRVHDAVIVPFGLSIVIAPTPASPPPAIDNMGNSAVCNDDLLEKGCDGLFLAP